MKRSKVIVTLLFIVSVHAPIYGFWTSLAAGLGSSLLSDQSKEMFKDAIDFSDIMGDLKVVNEDTRDSVTELLEHTQIIDQGDTFIDFASDYIYNMDPQVSILDYEFQKASRILQRYTGKNYYDEASESMKALLTELENSQRKLSDYTPSRNTDELDKDSKNYKNIEKKDGYLKADLKLQHAQIKLTQEISDTQKALSLITNDMNNREAAKDIEEEIKKQKAQEQHEEGLLPKPEKKKKTGPLAKVLAYFTYDTNKSREAMLKMSQEMADDTISNEEKEKEREAFKELVLEPLMVFLR